MAVMMAMGFAAAAGEKEHAFSEEAAAKVEKGIGEAGPATGEGGQGPCSFTAKGSVNTPVISFDFSCTATEESCKLAIQKALECARLAVKVVRDQFKS